MKVLDDKFGRDRHRNILGQINANRMQMTSAEGREKEREREVRFFCPSSSALSPSDKVQEIEIFRIGSFKAFGESNMVIKRISDLFQRVLIHEWV